MAKTKTAERPTEKSPPTQPELPGTATGQTTEQPEMAAKKDWGSLFAKGIKLDQDVPAVQRTGRSLPFPFDDLKLNAMFNVPKEFWVEFGGLTKTQSENASRNKEAIRRSFYGWRDKDTEARGKYAIAMSDQHDKGSYTGVNVYLVKAQAPSGKKK